MYPYLGDFPTGQTIYIPFHTFDSNDPSASVTITGLATTDIEVYKDGGTAQRSSDAGYTLLDTDGIDFDTITGIHGISIDTSDNTDAGFYAAGSDYWVVISSITVDAATVNFIAATFSIDNRGLLRPTTAQRTLDVTATGAAGIDWANVEGAGTTVDLSATSINLVDTATDVTNGVSLAAGAITNASLAGNMEIVFETDFATNYNATRNAWVTNAQDFVGTTAADPFNGQVAVASVATGVTLANGAVTDASLAGNMEIVFETDFATNYNTTRNGWATNIQDTIGTGNLPSDVQAIDSVAQAATNLEILMDGNEAFYTAYAGPRGPGVYIDDTNGTAGSTTGVHGTAGNPTTTIASAITLCTALGFNRVYLVANTDITLAATMEDFEFVGIGDATANSVALASQDVDRSGFFNLTISGVQGGSERVYYEKCIFGTATIYALARWCGFTDSVTGVTLSSNDDNILDGCFSMVAGNATPIFICSGANLDLSIRHYSGGVELQGCSATTTVSVETDGQVIIDATSSTSAVVTVRGCSSITDNAGLGANLTIDAVYNAAQILDAVTDDATKIDASAANAISADWTDGGRLDLLIDALQTEVEKLTTTAHTEPSGVPAANEAPIDKLGYLFMALRNRVDVTATKKTFYDDGGTGEWEKDLTDNGTTYSESEANAI